jgi:hypothetical protein
MIRTLPPVITRFHGDTIHRGNPRHLLKHLHDFWWQRYDLALERGRDTDDAEADAWEQVRLAPADEITFNKWRVAAIAREAVQ